MKCIGLLTQSASRKRAALLLVFAKLIGGALPGTAVAQGLDAPVVFKDDFSSAVAPSANSGRFYFYPVDAYPIVCGAPPFVQGQFSDAGCLAWFDEQPWNPLGPGGLGYLHSQSPWWTDPNHRIAVPDYNPNSLPNPNPGLGYINVIAFVEPPAAVNGPLNLVDATLSVRIRKDAAFDPLVAGSRVGPRKGHLYVWFQTSARALDPATCTPNPDNGEDCTRQTDYIMSDHDLSDPGYELDALIEPNSWNQLTATLFPLEAAWTCLGRGDNVKYECEPIATALTHVQYVGFIVAPVCTSPQTGFPGAVYSCQTQSVSPAAGWGARDYRYRQGQNLGAVDFANFLLTTPVIQSAAWFAYPGLAVGGIGADLTKIASVPVGWNASSSSTQVVTGGSAALDFVVGENQGTKIVGLSTQSDDTSPENVKYGFYFDASGTLYSYESGVAFGFAPPNDKYQAGDAFRVELSAGQGARSVTYFRNGLALPDRPRPDGPLDIAFPLEVATAMFTPGASVAGVAVSADNAHHAVNVAWSQPNANAQVSGHVLAHTGDAGSPGEAISSSGIAAGSGFVEVGAGDTGSYKIIGLSHTTAPTDYAGMDYGLYLYAGTAMVFEGGAARYSVPGSYSVLDRFRVAVDASGAQPVVKYYKNYSAGAVPFYVSGMPPAYPLVATAAIYSAGASFVNAIMSPTNEAIVWSAAATGGAPPVVPAGPVGPLVQPVAANAGTCASSVVATRALGYGDGGFEFVAPDAASGKRVGLARSFVPLDVSRIDFQLYLPDRRGPDQDVFVNEYSGGLPVTGYVSVGPYAALDRFRIGVEGGKVTYRRNGTLLYQDAQPLAAADYPLYFTLCTGDAAASVTDVVASGAGLVSSGLAP